MSHILPAAGSYARSLFDVADLVAIVTGERPVGTEICRLRLEARRIFAASKAANRVAFIRLNPSTDNLELVTVGRRGGWRREWIFGPVGRNARLA